MAIQEKFYSAEDLWELSHAPENAGKRFELAEGILLQYPLAGGQEGGIAGEIALLVGSYVRAHRLGYCTAAGTGYVLFKDPEGRRDTVRAPDVAFVRADRLPDGLPEGYMPFAPDLAVEVVGPDLAEELQGKVLDYLKYETRLVWVVYCQLESARVHTPTGDYWKEIDGTLEGGDVLPGLSIPLAEIFAAVGPIKKD